MDDTARRLFAAKLVKLRTARGWSQPELAAKAGIKPDLLIWLEKGVRDPELLTLVALGKALSVRAEVLWP